MKSDLQAWTDTFKKNISQQLCSSYSAPSLKTAASFSLSIVDITSISGVMEGSSNAIRLRFYHNRFLSPGEKNGNKIRGG